MDGGPSLLYGLLFPYYLRVLHSLVCPDSCSGTLCPHYKYMCYGLYGQKVMAVTDNIWFQLQSGGQETLPHLLYDHASRIV